MVPVETVATLADNYLWTEMDYGCWDKKISTSERKFKSNLYDILYDTAELILLEHEPCSVKSGRCLRKEFCCDCCHHLLRKRCSVKALACKLWLCEQAREKFPECAAALDALALIAGKYELVGYRLCKEDIFHEK